MSDLTARDLIVRAMGLLPTDGSAFRSLVAALNALVGEEESETCEDRGYACCDAFPPGEDPADDWYDTHVAAWYDEDPTAGFMIPQDR